MLEITRKSTVPRNELCHQCRGQFITQYPVRLKKERRGRVNYFYPIVKDRNKFRRGAFQIERILIASRSNIFKETAYSSYHPDSNERDGYARSRVGVISRVLSAPAIKTRRLFGTEFLITGPRTLYVRGCF